MSKTPDPTLSNKEVLVYARKIHRQSTDYDELMKFVEEANTRSAERKPARSYVLLVEAINIFNPTTYERVETRIFTVETRDEFDLLREVIHEGLIEKVIFHILLSDLLSEQESTILSRLDAYRKEKQN